MWIVAEADVSGGRAPMGWCEVHGCYTYRVDMVTRYLDLKEAGAQAEAITNSCFDGDFVKVVAEVEWLRACLEAKPQYIITDRVSVDGEDALRVYDAETHDMLDHAEDATRFRSRRVAQAVCDGLNEVWVYEEVKVMTYADWFDELHVPTTE